MPIPGSLVPFLECFDPGIHAYFLISFSSFSTQHYTLTQLQNVEKKSMSLTTTQDNLHKKWHPFFQKMVMLDKCMEVDTKTKDEFMDLIMTGHYDEVTVEQFRKCLPPQSMNIQEILDEADALKSKSKGECACLVDHGIGLTLES